MKKLVSFGLAVTLAVSGVSSLVAPTPVNAEASSYSFTKEQQEALNYINAIRAKIGVPPVKLNPFLNKAAENHAKYITINGGYGLEAHYEESSKKGFTGYDSTDRIKAVGGDPDGSYREIITFQKSTIIGGMDDFMTMAYHRDPLMAPYTEEIGVAISGGTVVIEAV